MPLSDISIRRAKPEAKPKKLFDSNGLYLLISPKGSRYWRWKYRILGKEKLMALGVYPAVSLALARQLRDEAKKLLVQKIDPSPHKKTQNIADDFDTFESVAREWLTKREWVDSYRVKVVAWLENDVFPWIGKQKINTLEAPDFLVVARRVEQRGAIESAHRINQNCGQIMRYAIATGRAKRNPVSDLRGALKAPPERHYPAITNPRELGQLLRAIDGYKGSFIVRCALYLAPLLFLRPGELRKAEWSEFDFDISAWNIPADRMKMRRPHLVPLPTQAVAALKELQPLTSKGIFVFPSARSNKRPMSDNAVNAGLRRLGYESGTVTGHGFRATARTILDEVLGFRPDIIEHQLAHTVRDPNGRAYNRTTHLDSRKDMMQCWADYLDKLRGIA